MPKKMIKRAEKKSLLVQILDEDVAYAKQQDRYACAIVRAIQRVLPQALRVRADTKEIAFSLPEDETRYYFQTPEDVIKKVIEPFDKTGNVPEYTFVLERASAAEPIRHLNAAQRAATRNKRRHETRPPRVRTSSGNVRTANRFRDYEAEEAQAS